MTSCQVKSKKSANYVIFIFIFINTWTLRQSFQAAASQSRIEDWLCDSCTFQADSFGYFTPRLHNVFLWPRLFEKLQQELGENDLQQYLKGTC